jgi:hypothetical protein
VKYVVETCSGANVHIPSFIEIGSGFQSLQGGYTDKQTAW